MSSLVMLDASIPIDHFRARNKEGTFYTRIIREYDIRLVSVVAKLEVLYGASSESVEYWDAVFATMTVVPFTDAMVKKSHEIVLDLKRKSLLIDMEDIMIAATALALKIPLATLNRKHFNRIDGLILIDNDKSHADP